MSETMKKPAIRFKGYCDDWGQRKLGDVASVFDGVHQTPDYKESGVMFLSVENIATLTSHKFISEEAFQRDYKVYPQNGDILMTRIGDVGTPNVVETTEKVAFYVSLALLKPNGVDSYFLCNSILSPFFQKGLKDRTLVTAIPQKINKDEIGKVDVMLPPSELEQIKIGALFQQLNNLITLHQQKHSKLQNIKKSMLEKMFPQNGAKVPEIRVAGFTGDWEQRKVRDIANRFDNLRIPVAANLRVPGTTPYYGANGIQDYVEGYTHEGEFVLVAEDGANDLKNYPVRCVKGRIWVNNHAHVLQGKPELADNQFLSYAINQADIESLLVGGSRAKLNAETLMDIELTLPHLEEQQIIGTYLFRLDNLITLHQRELEKLQNIKKSCLEKMFV